MRDSFVGLKGTGLLKHNTTSYFCRAQCFAHTEKLHVQKSHTQAMGVTVLGSH